MSQCHSLGAVGDKVAGDEGILHTPMTHGNAVADCDSGEHYRRAARHCNAQLNGVHNLVDVHMSRDYLVVGAYNSYHGAGYLLVCKTQRMIKRAVGSVAGSVFD